MSKKTKKINNSKDYEKSSFKGIIEDMEDTKNVGLKSVPKIRREHIPSTEETSKEILYGNGDSERTSKEL